MKTILEQLCEIEAFLAGEIRAFDADAKTAGDRGLTRGACYCIGASHAYGNVLARLRQLVPGRLTRDVIG